ncbi:MAG: methyltransferase [Bacteroidetes bacterium]|nr:methyltransferase [Bacteroidota bacterium]MBS1979140.1 methyltransferase [Bacteroidota bacterium]
MLLIPWTRWYLRKQRTHVYGDVRIVVRHGVFHPGLFPSTPMLLESLKDQPLLGVRLLELGCGTGLISIIAAKRGALVTASDISTNALQNAEQNAYSNNVDVEFIQSDVFENIEPILFDWVIVNPPYYRGNPVDEASMAWYAGANLEYFEKFYSGLGRYIHKNSKVLMSLTQECDLDGIHRIAIRYDFDWTMRNERNSVLDGKDYVFNIISSHRKLTTRLESSH